MFFPSSSRGLVKRIPSMKLLRAFLFLLVATATFGVGDLAQPQAAAAAVVAMVRAANVEAADLQSRTFAEAYNVLLDHYVHPLDTSAMLQAAWDNLAKEADSKAVAPGPSPEFTGDRAADLQAMRDALNQ